MGAIMEHNSEDRLSKINVPTLVIHGDEDLVVPVENGRLLAAKIKNARIVVLPATGHLYAPNTQGGWGLGWRALITCGRVLGGRATGFGTWSPSAASRPCRPSWPKAMRACNSH